MLLNFDFEEEIPYNKLIVGQTQIEKLVVCNSKPMSRLSMSG
jgi:hypothetical protein